MEKQITFLIAIRRIMTWGQGCASLETLLRLSLFSPLTDALSGVYPT